MVSFAGDTYLVERYLVESGPRAVYHRHAQSLDDLLWRVVRGRLHLREGDRGRGGGEDNGEGDDIHSHK